MLQPTLANKTYLNSSWRSNCLPRMGNPTFSRTMASDFIHTMNTHPEQWADIFAVAPREQLGVWYLAQGSHLSRGIEGGRERCTFTPPTYNPCRYRDSNVRPLGCKSDSLTIRPRLPPLATDTPGMPPQSFPGLLQIYKTRFFELTPNGYRSPEPGHQVLSCELLSQAGCFEILHLINHLFELAREREGQKLRV